MGSKVPKFGAWEGVQGGENFTVYFDNARKNKNNGQKINPNDPEENSDLFQPAPSQIRADEQRKTKHAGPSTAENEPRAQTQTQARPKAGLTPQGGRAKVPQFGAWNGGEGAQYTAYFDNAQKTMTDGGEPMMNRDVGDRGRAPPTTKARTGPPKDDVLRHPSRGSTSSVPGSGSEGLAKQGSVPKTPVQPSANHHARTGGSRGNQAAGVPTFGGWNSDPSQAEGYTVAFARAKEERNTPLNNNAPPSYYEPPHNNQKHAVCISFILLHLFLVAMLHLVAKAAGPSPALRG